MDNTAKYKAFENQSWLDISNILYGSSDYAYELAQLNEASITEDILAGRLISYPKDLQPNKLVLLSMASYKSIPATGISLADNQISPLQGIDYWTIQTDFIIG